MLARGAERARGVAASTLADVHEKIGFPATRRLLGAPRDRCIGPGRGRPGCVGPSGVGAGRRGGARGRAQGRRRQAVEARAAARPATAWLDHLVRAGARYTDHHGDHYAAAITFFSILSLVPLLMIAFAVAGYVLFFNPNLLNEIRDAINAALPPNMADTHQPDHRPGDRPAEHGGRLRPARRAVLRHRVDDEPARGAVGAVGAGAGAARRCRSGCCSTSPRCSASGSRWSGPSRSPARRPASPRTCWPSSVSRTRAGRRCCCACSASCSASPRTSWCSSG